ncbi:MAG: hypothetical protein PHV54_09010 [Tolumonas sp.]|nr:hypothetical protein [Tolumonas sp.]
MLATTLIRLFLRLSSLWIMFLSLQRGVLTLLIQDIHVVSAQWTIVLSVLFFSLAVLMWTLSARLSKFIVGNDEQARELGWSSQEVVLSGLVLISLYTLFIDAIPAIFDIISRISLLLASGQFVYLGNPSILVPGSIAFVKVGFAVIITMHARTISSKVINFQ